MEQISCDDFVHLNGEDIYWAKMLFKVEKGRELLRLFIKLRREGMARPLLGVGESDDHISLIWRNITCVMSRSTLRYTLINTLEQPPYLSNLTVDRAVEWICASF